jgi:hypothetical protein
MMKVRWIVLMVVVIVVLGMFWTRHQVVELSGVGGFYRINRLTGNAELIAGILTQRVKGVRESQIEIVRQQELRQKGGTPTVPSPKP